MKKLTNTQLAKLITTMDDIGLVKGKIFKMCFKELGKRPFAEFDEMEGIITKHKCSTSTMKRVTKIAKKHYNADKSILFTRGVEKTSTQETN